MAYITKLAFMNECYAYGRINVWGSQFYTCHGDLLGGQLKRELLYNVLLIFPLNSSKSVARR